MCEAARILVTARSVTVYVAHRAGGGINHVIVLYLALCQGRGRGNSDRGGAAVAKGVLHCHYLDARGGIYPYRYQLILGSLRLAGYSTARTNGLRGETVTYPLRYIRVVAQGLREAARILVNARSVTVYVAHRAGGGVNHVIVLYLALCQGRG